MARLTAVLLCAATLLVVACGDSDGGSEDGGSQGGGAYGGAASQGGSGAGDGSGGGGGAGGDGSDSGGAGSGPCREVAAPEPKPDGGAEKPKKQLARGKTYDVTLTTNCGDIVIRVDQRTSPKTAASFVSLVRSGFYDDTTFHRIVPGFVIQGGDPTGSGAGGPGYSVRDVPPRDAAYTEGVVAMAKTAAEPPGTAGSQFYIVTAPDAGLPPDYALLGKVVRGMDVARAIDELGDPASGEMGTPLQPVVIEKATVSES